MRAKPFLVMLFCAVLLCMLSACEQSEPIVHQHEYMTMEATEPGCTVAGHSEGRKCRTCGFIFDPPQLVPATGHVYADEWTIDREPTEYREGEKSLHCTRCGKRSAVSPIARLAPSTQGLAYELNAAQDGYVCVGIGTATMEKELRIPEVYNGLPVTEIGEYAFENNRRIVSLSLPQSIKTVGRSAFSGCSALSSIDLPDTLEYMGSYAFQNTDYYSNHLNWDNGTLYIGRHLIAVSATAATGSYAVRQGTRVICGAAFINCSKMTSISIPEGVVSIGNSSLYGCSALQSIDLPDSLRIIGNGALSYCTSLTDFCLPAGVSDILSSPFPGSTSLTTLTVDENNPHFYSVDNCLIERSTGTLVSGCATSIIPDNGSIKRIGDGAFYQFPLRSVTLPEGTLAVGIAAFYQCLELEQISLPSTLTAIERQAFQGCEALSQLSFPEGFRIIGENAFNGCKALTELTLPEGVEIISIGAFANCARLRSLTIPSTLTTVCADALMNCTVLSSLHYAGTAQQWEKITKETGWDRGTFQLDIHYAQ